MKSARARRRTIPPGKLPPAILVRELRKIRRTDPRVRIGPRYGDDAAVIDMGGRFLVLTCDPVTLASGELGRYAVHINANDIAVMGAVPRWFWATLLLPEGKSDERMIRALCAGIRDACREIGVELCGGHTEITAGLTRPILSGFMGGEASPAELVDKTSIRPGDAILLVRGVAIEGTATIAREHTGKISRLGPRLVRRARALFRSPGISVLKEARLARAAAPLHAMHDPTEGGLFTGLRELACAAGVGLEIEEERIMVLPETAAICSLLNLDPMGLLASGALIVVAGGGHAAALLRAFRSSGVPARLIGTAREKGFGIMLRRKGTLLPLPVFDRDELLKVL